MLPPDLQHALIQQADKIEDYKSTRDRVATIVVAKLALKNPDAMECDAVHRSSGHAEAWEDNSEACDVDAVNSKSVLFCYRCGGQGHIAAKCATPAPTKGKGKDGGKGGKAGGKGGGNKETGKGEWNGFCSYCGKKGHGPRDCWTKQKDEAKKREDRTSGTLRRISADSKSAAWTKKRCTRQGCIFPTGSRH